MSDITYCTCAEPFWRQLVNSDIWCSRCGYFHGFVEPEPPEEIDTAPTRRGKAK